MARMMYVGPDRSVDIDAVCRHLGIDDDEVWSISRRLERDKVCYRFVVQYLDGRSRAFMLTIDGPVWEPDRD